MTRICKDCRHYRNAAADMGGTPRCAVAVHLNLVSGERERLYCETARNFGPCGQEGNLFEPRHVPATLEGQLRASLAMEMT